MSALELVPQSTKRKIVVGWLACIVDHLSSSSESIPLYPWGDNTWFRELDVVLDGREAQSFTFVYRIRTLHPK